MDRLKLPDDFNRVGNCVFTATGGEQVKMSVETLFKLINTLPKIPKILTIPIQMKELKILSSNTILISSDIAEALEDAMKGEHVVLDEQVKEINEEINFYNNKPEAEFESYKAQYPHVPEKELRDEWEDNSGDLRHARLCAETGQWP